MGTPMREEDLIRMNKVIRHRLRNSASGLKASITFLSKELAGRLNARELEYFPLIQQECDAITAVTNRMQLLFEPVRPSPAFPLDEIIETAVQSVRGEFPTTAFLREGAPADKWLAPQRDVFLIPLSELLRNAAEAAPGREVGIRLTDDDTQCVIRVTDSGPGFTAPEDPFLPFFTTKTRHLGVGLCIARNYAEYLGGSITCAREAEQTTVTLTFPACPNLSTASNG